MGARDLPASLSELVLRQAKEHPDAIAVSLGEDVLSYAGLAERCGRFAAQLSDRGADGGVVAVSVPRGLDLVVSLLAVLAAGASYLPLDSGLPAARRRRLAAGARAILVVAPAADAATFDGLSVLPVEASHDAGQVSAALPRRSCIPHSGPAAGSCCC
jgi:non-ribosomal peptide synthetase component F